MLDRGFTAAGFDEPGLSSSGAPTSARRRGADLRAAAGGRRADQPRPGPRCASGTAGSWTPTCSAGTAARRRLRPVSETGLMTALEEELPLASEFPAASREQWQQLVAGRAGASPARPALRMAAAEQALATEVEDGLRVQPAVHRGGHGGLIPGWPGLRAVHRAAGERRARPLAGWDVRQRHADPDPQRTNGPCSPTWRTAPPRSGWRSAVRACRSPRCRRRARRRLPGPGRRRAGRGRRLRRGRRAAVRAGDRRPGGDRAGEVSGQPRRRPDRAARPHRQDADTAPRLGRRRCSPRAASASSRAAGADRRRAALPRRRRHRRAGAGLLAAPPASPTCGRSPRPGLSVGRRRRRSSSSASRSTADQFATIAKLRAARRLWARVAEVCGAGRPARRSASTR